MTSGLRVAVLGASGAVGREFLTLFERRRFPIADLKLLASPRSAGRVVSFGGRDIAIEPVSADSFAGVDVAFFSAGASRSKEFAPAAVAAGATVIDNSSAFRMDPDVPLVVPEINFDSVRPEHKIVANPNCSAIIALMAIKPLSTLGRLERAIISTYQSASGAGWQAMEELREQTRDVLEGRPAVPKVLPHPYAFNLFSHNTPINEAGYNDEEWKVIQESRKILSRPDLKINVTCVRVPVLRAHSESITLEYAGPAPKVEEARAAIESFPGTRLVDDRENNVFPMPLDASGIDEVLVGRIRLDVSNPNALCLFVSGDQLLKGAALNAVQIAERLAEAGRFG
ncbi:MAG: aspartate-semialdehyde dehydrogenase [Fimbriimonadaceae bacterium]